VAVTTRKRSLTIIILIAALGVLLAVPAALPSASATPPPSGQISGTVTGAGGVAVPGTTGIKVVRWDAGTGQWDFDLPEVFADAGGHYVAGGLAAGTYRISFQPQSVDWLGDYWNGAHTFDAATDIVLTDGEQRVGVDAALRPAARIIGTAHSPDGTPIRSLDVVAWPSDDGPPNGHGHGGDSGGVSGAYGIFGLEPGTYRVEIIDHFGAWPTEFWHDSSTFAQATDIVVGLGQTVDLGDSVLGFPVTNTARPTISGHPMVGRRLTARAGSWSPEQVSYAYQWFAGHKAIKGATRSTLKLKTAQLGKKITVQVTASAPGTTSGAATSKATRKVRPRSHNG